MRHLVTLAPEFQALGVDLVVLDQSIDTTTPTGRLLFHVLAAIAEFERELIRERVCARLQRARAQGRRPGRPRQHYVDPGRARTLTPWASTVSDEAVKTARLSPRLIQKLRTRLGLSQAALAKLAGVSGTAVVQWEQGRAAPSGDRRKAVVALRTLGRREVKRLLARMPAPAAKRYLDAGRVGAGCGGAAKGT